MKLILLAIMATILYAPGQTVPEKDIDNIDKYFTISPIPDDIFEKMQGKSYKSDCNVPRDSLKYITCLHCDADGNTIVGEMVVGNRIADKIIIILKELYKARYPIQKMRLVDYYNAEDEKSMADNNSSSFNFRFISHSTKVSKHGLGIAVDINPLYNPYWKILKDGTESIEPANSKPYLDRTKDFPYKITADDPCCRLFKKYGFEWGGDWKTCKDYQHFELK